MPNDDLFRMEPGAEVELPSALSPILRVRRRPRLLSFGRYVPSGYWYTESYDRTAATTKRLGFFRAGQLCLEFCLDPNQSASSPWPGLQPSETPQPLFIISIEPGDPTRPRRNSIAFNAIGAPIRSKEIPPDATHYELQIDNVDERLNILRVINPGVNRVRRSFGI